MQGYKNIQTPKGEKFAYNPMDELGKGAFGSVYKGQNVRTGEIVAIKLVNVEKLLKQYKTNEIVKAVGREVNILQKLTEGTNNPYIVKIYDCCKIASHVYIILEYCDGGSLEDVMDSRNGKLKEKDAKIILYQIVMGLNAIHEQNIAHRDMKPDNIFIRGKYFKLGDFGFATDKNKFTTQLGTQPYMAPEILSENPNYTVKVDIWALGCMYHQMLFGQIPFNSATLFTLKAMFDKMKKYQLPKNAGKVSPESKDILERMLEKNVGKRITSAELLNHPLFDPIKKIPFLAESQKLVQSSIQQSEYDSKKYQNAQSQAFTQPDFPQPQMSTIPNKVNGNSNIFQQQGQNNFQQQQSYMQPGFPQQSQGYQPSYMQPGFPQQQQSGYPQQSFMQPGFQPQQPGFAPQQPGFAPQQPQFQQSQQQPSFNQQQGYSQQQQGFQSQQQPQQFQPQQQNKFLPYKDLGKLSPKVASSKDEIHSVVFNYRNLLMTLWKCYEQLGKAKYFEAAFLMGEKLSKSLLALQISLSTKQLKVRLGNITQQNWVAYCNSSRAMKFLNDRLCADNKLLGNHFNNLTSFLDSQNQNALKQSQQLQSNYPLRKAMLLSVADQLIKKGELVLAMDLVLFSDLDQWMNLGVNIDKYDKRTKIPADKQKRIMLTGQYHIFIK